MMIKMGFDVVALNFMSPFCTCTAKSASCKNEAKKLADELGIKARIEFMGQEYIDMIKTPKFGYGSGMNPCIDCRVMVFRRSREIMLEEGAKFIFTGEVVGQRPMSQLKHRMELIDKESGLKGYVVRPLSAQLLPPTIPEIEGIIDREKMLSIQGRSRKPQIKMAKEEFGMTENLCSSGGCLLTDKQFSERIGDLLEHDDTAGVRDARLLRLGRHFRISDECKLIVGRNQEENERIERMADEHDMLFYPARIRGPLALLKGRPGAGDLDLSGRVTARYCEQTQIDEVEIEYLQKGSDGRFLLRVLPAGEEILDELRV